MAILILILSIVILISFLIFALLFAMDSLNANRQLDPLKKPGILSRSKILKRIFAAIAIMVLLSILGIILIYIVHSIMAEEKLVKPKINTACKKTYFSPEHHARLNSPSDIGESTGKKVTLSSPADRLLPFTRGPSSSKIHEKEKLYQAKYVLTKLSGARKGDVFICGFYDQLENGYFVKSKECRYIQPRTTSKYSVKARIYIKRLEEGHCIQLPMLLTGRIITDNNKQPFKIYENGILQATSAIEESSFEYSMYRSEEKLPDAITDSKVSEWMRREYHDIPLPILNILQAARLKSETARLSAAAFILNSYFGYQSQANQIILPEGSTWNYLLKKTICRKERLLCDCDVLSVFAFIYLKFLEFNPVLLTCYVNNTQDKVSGCQLHTTIYLKYNGKWLFFEPTFFVSDYAASHQVKGAPEQYGISPARHAARQHNLSAQQQKKPIDAVKNSMINHFSVPVGTVMPLNNSQKTHDIYTTKTISNLLSVCKVRHLFTEPSSDISFNKPGIAIQLSVIIYILTMVISILHIHRSDIRIMLLRPKRLLIFLFVIILLTIFIQLFSNLYRLHLEPQDNFRINYSIVPLICYISAICGIISVLAGNILVAIKGFLTGAVMFSLSACLLAPSVITFLSMACISIIAIYVIKKLHHA